MQTLHVDCWLKYSLLLVSFHWLCSFYSAFLINKWTQAVFCTLHIIDHIIYTSGEFPVQMTLFALNTHL